MEKLKNNLTHTSLAARLTNSFQKGLCQLFWLHYNIITSVITIYIYIIIIGQPWNNLISCMIYEFQIAIFIILWFVMFQCSLINENFKCCEGLVCHQFAPYSNNTIDTGFCAHSKETTWFQNHNSLYKIK